MLSNNISFVIKYENLSDYRNLWMIIHIDVYLFVTPYKRVKPLVKIHYVFFLHYDFSFSFFSSSTLLFYNILSSQRFKYAKKKKNYAQGKKIEECSR